MNNCCENMGVSIDQGIDYSPRFREYSLSVSDTVRQGIWFCPWCGKMLPKELTDEWYAEMYALLGEDFDGDDPRIPHEFLTDQWWRKRGL